MRVSHHYESLIFFFAIYLLNVGKLIQMIIFQEIIGIKPYQIHPAIFLDELSFSFFQTLSLL